MKIEFTSSELNHIIKRTVGSFIREFTKENKNLSSMPIETVKDNLDDSLNLNLQRHIWDAIYKEMTNDKAFDDYMMKIHNICIDSIESKVESLYENDEFTKDLLNSRYYKESWKKKQYY